MNTKKLSTKTSHISKTDFLPLQKRLEVLSQPIFESYGVYYPIAVSQRETEVAAMDFRTLYFNSFCGIFSDEELTMILLHETGHRCRAPKSQSITNDLARILILQHNLKWGTAINLIHLASDLIVDRTLAHSNWSKLYVPHFISVFNGFVQEDSVRDDKGVEVLADAKTMRQLYMCLRISNVSRIELPDRLKPYLEKIQPLFEILFPVAPIGEEFAVRFYTDNTHMKDRIIHFCLATHVITQRMMKSTDFDTLSKLLDELSSLFNPSTGNGDTGGESDPIFSSKNHQNGPVNEPNGTMGRKGIFDLPLVDKVTTHLQSRVHKKRLAIWDTDKPAHLLDRVRSKQSGRLVPGLTTVMQISGKSLSSKDDPYSKVVLVIDESGSMASASVWVRSIAEGLRRYISSTAGIMGLISFGSHLGEVIRPGDKYTILKDAVHQLKGNLGGTSLSPALKKASSWVRDSKLDTCILITDAKVDDFESVKLEIQLLTERMNLLVLLVNSSIPTNLKELQESRNSPIRILQINPIQKMTEATLKEIFI